MKKIITSIAIGSLSVGIFSGYNTAALAETNNDGLVIKNGVLEDGKNAKGEVTIPESVTTIGDNAFEDNKDITKIICPSSLETIRYSAFKGCSNLSEIVLNNKIKEIGEEAFSNCNIKKVNIPSSIQFIFLEAFDSDVEFVGNTVAYNQAKDRGNTLNKISVGRQIDGWRTMDGKYYLKLNGEFKTGWVNYEGKTYYFYSNFQMATGFINLNGVHYYLDPVVKLNKDDLYFDGQNYGNVKTGWQKINNKWYYFSPAAEGKKAKGFMKTAWLSNGGNWYYFYGDGTMATGFINLNGAYYYLNNSGAMLSGWQKINGKWYYFNKKSDGGIFGLMKKGWQKIGGSWYYFYPSNGQMASNTWVGGYHLNASGAWDR